MKFKMNEYWMVRLPQNKPDGLLNKVKVVDATYSTVKLDLADPEAPFRNYNIFETNTIDFIEKVDKYGNVAETDQRRIENPERLERYQSFPPKFDFGQILKLKPEMVPWDHMA